MAGMPVCRQKRTYLFDDYDRARATIAIDKIVIHNWPIAVAGLAVLLLIFH